MQFFIGDESFSKTMINFQKNNTFHEFKQFLTDPLKIIIKNHDFLKLPQDILFHAGFYFPVSGDQGPEVYLFVIFHIFEFNFELQSLHVQSYSLLYYDLFTYFM